ncbi:MAG: sodium ion-translocating decarboxylase subunit beta, partial [Anaerolineae bacterium]
AYSPALTDFIIMTERTSFTFITGPDVIRAVTGEQVDMETLGEAGVHNSTSGVAHFRAPSEEEALGLCRRLLSCLPSNNVENPPHGESADDPWRMDPELNDLVPLDDAAPYDMRDVIRRVVDLGSFLEVQAGWAQNAIVGVVERLSSSAQNEIINIATIFLGLAIGSTMTAASFLNLRTFGILLLGLLAFVLDTAAGLLFGKLLCILSGRRINPLIGAAGISAFPMSGRLVQRIAQEEDFANFILMHAMGANTAGQLGSVVAGGVLLALLGGG